VQYCANTLFGKAIKAKAARVIIFKNLVEKIKLENRTFQMYGFQALKQIITKIIAYKEKLINKL
jgi:hypothetical protein